MTIRRGLPASLRSLIPLGTALLLMVLLPFLFFAALFWAAEGSWDFEGRSGLRYWVFVKGSRLDRLGLVAPVQDPPPKYSVSLQEGTFPGWKVLAYQSTATPRAIIAAYAERCQALGLRVTKRTEPADDDDSIASLVCEIEPYLDAEFRAERKPPATTTKVGLRVWGSD